MEFSRQEYWSGLLFPSLGDLPDAGIEPESSALQANSLLSEPPTLEVKVESFIHQGAVKSWALAVSRYNWTELSESTVLELERQPLWTGNIRRRRLKCQSYTGTLLVISPLKCTKGENILNTVFFLLLFYIDWLKWMFFSARKWIYIFKVPLNSTSRRSVPWTVDLILLIR